MKRARQRAPSDKSVPTAVLQPVNAAQLGSDTHSDSLSTSGDNFRESKIRRTSQMLRWWKTLACTSAPVDSRGGAIFF
jgi:hypothetical protein